MSESVSLIFTVRDEAASLGQFLTALASQTRLPDEIVVVDGGSTDGTIRVLSDSRRSLPMLRAYVAERASISEGRNLAIERAQGPIVAVTDAGTVAAPTWLEELVRPLELDPQIAVSSGFFVAGGANAFERCLTTVITPQLYEIDPDRFLPSSRSVAFRKDWWSRAGGYPEWLQHCEDLVFDLMLKQEGARFEFAPAAVVTWRARRTLRGFTRQYYNYARGDGHAHLWTLRHAIRYSAYSVGFALMLASGRRRRFLAALGGGMMIHFSKYFVRALRHRAPSRMESAATLVLVPPIVVLGDFAKMVGYPVGLCQRYRQGKAGLENRFKRGDAAVTREVAGMGDGDAVKPP